MKGLDERLNAALDRLVSDDFLQGRGLGNEIAFYVFDYPADQEPYVRTRIASLVAEVQRRRAGLRVAHVDLFALVVKHLRSRNLLERTYEMQRRKGDAETIRTLAAPLRADRVSQAFASAASPQEQDLVFLSGIGGAYPLVRTHGLLNNLQTVMGTTPLVLFFPGTYSGQHLALFDKLHDENYYRAFRLIP